MQLDVNGFPIKSFNIGTVGDNSIFSVKFQPDGNLLIGGNFSSIGNAVGAGSTSAATGAYLIPKGIARIKVLVTADANNGNHQLDASFLTNTSAEPGFTGGTDVYEGKAVIRDINLQSDGKVVVGGDFLKYDGTARRMVARI
ncbi:MAG: hypothetical protein EOO95_08950, partial [Pedobacter sp.]